MRALQGIYGIPEMAPNLELFTERFKVWKTGKNWEMRVGGGKWEKTEEK